MPDQPPECCLCGALCEPWHEPPTGYGHNPEPLAHHPDRCCTECNTTKVIPARFGVMWNYPIPDNNQKDN